MEKVMFFLLLSSMLQYFQYFDSYFIKFGAERKHIIFIILLVQIHIKMIMYLILS